MSDPKPQGNHFNEEITPRKVEPDTRENPSGHLGAEDAEIQDNAQEAESQTPRITAPEVLDHQSRSTKETLEEFKKDMTGG